jgi:hypothetical protein
MVYRRGHWASRCRSADLREIITLEPDSKVTFFQATGPREGAIINELYEDEGEARYRFMKTYNELIGKRMTDPGLTFLRELPKSC